MRNNAGKVMTIYGIPRIIKISFPLAITPKNVIAGFSNIEIWPVNINIFMETDFLSNTVTDRSLSPAPLIDTSNLDPSVSFETSKLILTDSNSVPNAIVQTIQQDFSQLSILQVLKHSINPLQSIDNINFS